MSSGHTETRQKVKVSDAFLMKVAEHPSLQAAVKEAKRIDNTHDVPYLGGISKDGKTVYIDRRLPRYQDFAGKRMDVWKHIALHEAVEHALMTGLVPDDHRLTTDPKKAAEGPRKKLDYQKAHHIATRIEEAGVRHDGFSVAKYRARLRPWIRTADAESVKNPPPDLYEKPYTDEHDKTELKKLNPAQKKLHIATGFAGFH